MEVGVRCWLRRLKDQDSEMFLPQTLPPLAALDKHPGVCGGGRRDLVHMGSPGWC